MRGSLGSHSTPRTVAPLFLHVPLAGHGRDLQACERHCEGGVRQTEPQQTSAWHRGGMGASSLHFRAGPSPPRAQEEKSTCPGDGLLSLHSLSPAFMTTSLSGDGHEALTSSRWDLDEFLSLKLSDKPAS